MKMRSLFLSLVLLGACSGGPATSPASEANSEPGRPVTPPAETPQPQLARPNVEIVGAAPPFTYWAPEGSRIEPHPTNPGVWIAKGPGRSQIYYFGDGCGAAGLQRFVGRSLSDLPPMPEGAEWRFIDGAHNQDLRSTRLNIYHEPDSTVITAVACH